MTDLSRRTQAWAARRQMLICTRDGLFAPRYQPPDWRAMRARQYAAARAEYEAALATLHPTPETWKDAA